MASTDEPTRDDPSTGDQRGSQATDPGNPADPADQENVVARMAQRFTAFTERYLPDAFGFVLIGTFLIFALGLATGEPITGTPEDQTATTGFGLVDAWGQGFWALIEFTLQMAMIIIGGYAVAVSPPVARLIARLATVPKHPRSAITFTAAVAMLTSYLNWAFSLIFTAILAREIARVLRGVDYRALGAMAFLGLGTVWAQGLSGSAALLMTSEGSVPEPLKEIVREGGGADDGLIPLTRTIFLWQGVLTTLVVFCVAVAMAWLLAPSPANAKTAEDLGIELRPVYSGPTTAGSTNPGSTTRTRPGEWLETSPLFSILIFLLGAWYLVRYFADSTGNPLNALNLNTVNLILIMLALILHWRPVSLVDAVRRGAPAASGVLLQFPFYGGIFGMIVFTGLSDRIAGWLVDVSSNLLFAPLVAIYSCVLGIFVPSGGSKWLIEAPYVIDAANQLGVNQGWTVVVYDLGEASANLLQPFWMLPTLAILGLKARDIMGYTFAMFLVCFPVVLILVTVFAQTLPFP